MKEWVKRYGIHAIACIIILGIAFTINTRINIAHEHVYTLSEPVHTLLKMITSVTEENGKINFKGWGFDVENYNEDSKCELILHDVENEDDIWVNMAKKPESVEVPEVYAEGEDYSASGFEGTVRKSELSNDSVYEILLRYTEDYLDENEEKQQYVKTVTTDKFFYQGEMTEYNPKTFVELDIAGTELEKELEGAKLFHYFPEGMWVYYDEESLYYVATKELMQGKEQYEIPVQWVPAEISNLPEERRQYGFGNAGFIVESRKDLNLETEQYTVLRTNIPTNYGMYFSTGLYSKETGLILESTKQFIFCK